MKNEKISPVAVFVYGTVALTAIISVVALVLYYGGVTESAVVKWTGVVTFMIAYHLGLRLIMGVVNEKIPIDYNHPFFKPCSFEPTLYRALRVRLWRDKALTFRPHDFLLSERTLPEIARTMAKVELDHWVNEIISLTAIPFFLVFGAFPIFLVSSAAAMLFDAQFIVLQRFNRPKIIKLIEGEKRKAERRRKRLSDAETTLKQRIVSSEHT